MLVGEVLILCRAADVTDIAVIEDDEAPLPKDDAILAQGVRTYSRSFPSPLLARTHPKPWMMKHFSDVNCPSGHSKYPMSAKPCG